MFQPMQDWQEKCAAQVTGKMLPAGHFIPDQVPELLLPEMLSFFNENG
jgi:haloacetate dehalogenase